MIQSEDYTVIRFTPKLVSIFIIIKTGEKTRKNVRLEISNQYITNMAFSIESQGQKDLKMVKAVCICKKRLMLRSTAKLGFESIVCDKCEKTCDDTKVFHCVNTSAA
eukprot:142705_1